MENLGIDSKLLLAQLINFVLFFFLFKKYMAGPFMQFLHKERKKEEEKAKILEEVKKKEENLSKMEAEMRKKAKKEMDELLQRAKEDAEQIKADIIAQAKKDAETIKAQTKRQLQEERESLYKEVKEQSVQLSTVIVNKALKEYLTEDVQKKLTEHILTNLSKDASIN